MRLNAEGLADYLTPLALTAKPRLNFKRQLAWRQIGIKGLASITDLCPILFITE